MSTSTPPPSEPRIRLRRFRDPADVVHAVLPEKLSDLIKRGDVDLEDEVFVAKLNEWRRVWQCRPFRDRLPTGWQKLMDTQRGVLDDCMATVRGSPNGIEVYREQRERLLRELRAGELHTVIAPPGAQAHLRPPPSPVQYPEELTRDYAFIRPLGVGGSSTVGLWRKNDTGTEVAIKVTHPEFSQHVIQELRNLESVSSPYVVRVRHSGRFSDDSGRWWIVFDYVPGKPLREVLAQRATAPLPASQLWQILCGLAKGLASLHAKGVVHRDLTPSNVILRETDDPNECMPVLIDLGLARSGITSGQTLIGGTPGYQSPEQERGESCSPAADIYCFGRLAYELATGKPLAGAQLIDIDRACPGLPPGLDALIKKRCLDAEPKGRLPDGATLVEALEQLKRESPRSDVAALQVPQIQPTARENRGARRAFFRRKLKDLEARAQGNDVEAMRNLGVLLLGRDKREAATWLKKAADAGDARAQVELGRLKATVRGVDSESREAITLFREAARSGNADARFELFLIYRSGKLGEQRSPVVATDWVNDAASAGHPRAMYHLARALERGTHRPKDRAQAVAWLREGAERGDLLCMGALSVRLWRGLGCIQDRNEARRWIRQALWNATRRIVQWLLARLLTTVLGLALLATMMSLLAWWYFEWTLFGFRFPSAWLSSQFQSLMRP